MKGLYIYKAYVQWSLAFYLIERGEWLLGMRAFLAQIEMNEVNWTAFTNFQDSGNGTYIHN